MEYAHLPLMPPLARSMCLFLQNQDFQLHAEYMLGSLYDGGKEAASRLLLVNASISQQVGLTSTHSVHAATGKGRISCCIVMRCLVCLMS